ncbi:MAG: phosphoglycerate kinase [Candidatus Hatepunaea meridiana]|nr:phosphoglycerate kinase [Candidatus Hatepunaea meridiana]
MLEPVTKFRTNKITLDDLKITGQRVLVRVDFNVPLDDEGRVREFTRIKTALPTIHNILDYDGKAILMSHFGRPDGKHVPRFSLKPVAVELQRLLGKDVKFAQDCIGPEIEAMTRSLKPGEVLLLENVRFHPGEAIDDPAYAAELAKMGDVFVNDAFGAAHRKQASVHAIASCFPGSAAAGRLMMRELRTLGRTLNDPIKPFIGIVGGVKISSKIKTVERVLPRVKKMLIGGGMAYTFIKARGGNIGDSTFEPDKLSIAEKILSGPGAEKIILPIDSIAAKDLAYGSERKTFPSGQIPDGWRGLDLGRKARSQYRKEIKKVKTVFWNGPMGYFEREPYASGTRAVARAMVDLAINGGVSVVGGGDSMAALYKFEFAAPMTHISTGGGSLLEFIEGKPLPGFRALSDRVNDISNGKHTGVKKS